MRRTNRGPGVAFWGMLLSLSLGGLLGGQAPAQETLPAPRPNSPDHALIIPINGTQRVQMSTKQRIVTVLNQKDTVARVQPVQGDPTSVLITGLEPGITHVTFTDVNNRTESIDVVVQFDVEYLRNLLRRAVPTAYIEPIPAANNTIILTGWVAHAEDVDIILRVTQSVVLGQDRIINALQVGGVQQVELCVVVARVDRSKVRNMAFAFTDLGQHHKFDSTLGDAFQATANASPIFPNEANSLSSGGANLILGFLNNKQAFTGYLNALKTEGLAKILAEPRLVALSGRPGSFLDGGEQAIPVPAGLGQVGVQFEEFGTRLNFLPIVLGNGKIHLEVEPEVSVLSNEGAVNIQGATVQGRLTQRVHTTVEMEDGQTLLIGGLIQTQVTATTVKVPVLGEIPFLGAAFSSKDYNEDEHELVVMVTPHLIDPMDCSQIPHLVPGTETRTPDDFELFLEGILEAPRGQREVCPRGRYMPAYQNSPTAGQFPCGCQDGCGTCGSGGKHGGAGCACGCPSDCGAPAPVPLHAPLPPGPVDHTIYPASGPQPQLPPALAQDSHEQAPSTVSPAGAALPPAPVPVPAPVPRGVAKGDNP